MDPAVPSLLLTLLTALYVILTYRLVRETRRATDLSQASIECQARLSIFPQLAASASRTAGKVVLELWNPGDSSSMDVDLLVVAVYDQETLAPDEFINRFVARAQRPQVKIRPNEDGFFGVYDHCCYALFPPHRKLRVQLALPLPPDTFHLLLQFRDLAGNNYIRHYWFIRPIATPASPRYSIGALDTAGFEPRPRITYAPREPFPLETEDNSPIPDDIEREFLPSWTASVPSGQLVGIPMDVEDRGDWTEL